MEKKEKKSHIPDEKKHGAFSLFNMDISTKSGNVTIRVLVDFFVLSIVAAFVSLFYVYLTPFQRGYFCDDENIMYPVKKEIITNAILYSCGVLIPLALIVVMEYIRHLKDKLSESEILFFGWQVPNMIQKIYLYGGIFLYGAVITEIATKSIKMLAGRLRPSFMEKCTPDFNCFNIDKFHFFVENYTCTNTALTDENDLRQSFPSGHTSFSTYVVIYIVMYLQKRMNVSHSTLEKPIIQFLLMLLVTYVALSRIQDNNHHWDDVLGGFVIGLTIGLITVFTQIDFFKAESTIPEECNNTEERKYGTFSMFTIDTSTKNGNVTTRVLIDFVVLSIVAAFISLFYAYLTPFQRGYFCDDENIMYPIKQENITNAMLYSGGILIPLALIAFTEYIRHLNEKVPAREVFFFGWRVPNMCQKMYLHGGIFLFGVVITEIATNYVKVLVGRLRPSFLAMCKPDFNCSEVDNPHFFVANYTCTNTELTNKNDIRLSFPSGHTSISTYTMVYAVIYLQKRMNFGHSSFQKPIIQFLLLLLATYVALSRIQDNHHHWDDIFGGFMIGFTICLITVFTQSDLFKVESTGAEECTVRQQTKIDFP